MGLSLEGLPARRLGSRRGVRLAHAGRGRCRAAVRSACRGRFSGRGLVAGLGPRRGRRVRDGRLHADDGGSQLRAGRCRLADVLAKFSAKTAARWRGGRLVELTRNAVRIVNAALPFTERLSLNSFGDVWTQTDEEVSDLPEAGSAPTSMSGSVPSPIPGGPARRRRKSEERG